MRTPTRYWLIASTSGLLLTSFGLLELMIRRDAAPSGYLLNKSLASTAFLMIALSFSFSAIHYFSGRFKAGLALRRPFGLTGFSIAVLHVGTTLLVKDPENPLTNKFPFPDYFLEHWVAILFSSLAFAYFCYACKISVAPGQLLGTPARSRLWRKRLRYGYIAISFIFIHAIMLKFEGWIDWFSTFNPILPPLSLVVILLGSLLFGIKIRHLLKVQRLF